MSAVSKVAFVVKVKLRKSSLCSNIFGGVARTKPFSNDSAVIISLLIQR